MWRAGQGFVGHAFDFFQFVHQVQLRGQTSGCVGNHHVQLFGLRRGDGVKYDRRRIAGFLRDHGDVVALTPDGELLTRRCAEGVARCENDLFVHCLQVVCEFADAGGFTRTVHARDHQYQWAMRVNVQFFFQWTQQFDQDTLQGVAHALRILDALFFHPRTHGREDFFSGVHAHIGHEQGVFERFKQGFVHAYADKHMAQIRSGFAQSGAQSRQPAALGKLLCAGFVLCLRLWCDEGFFACICVVCAICAVFGVRLVCRNLRQLIVQGAIENISKAGFDLRCAAVVCRCIGRSCGRSCGRSISGCLAQ